MEINAKRLNELAKEMGFIRDNLEKMVKRSSLVDSRQKTIARISFLMIQKF